MPVIRPNKQASQLLRANPRFARIVARIAKDASKLEGRRVTSTEITGHIANIVNGATWGEITTALPIALRLPLPASAPTQAKDTTP